MTGAHTARTDRHSSHFYALYFTDPKEEREKYRERAQKRQRQGEYRWEEIKMGNALAFQRAQHRRFRAKDGSKEQSEEESTMLLSETSTLKNGIFVP